jgi:hypothetical protein
MLPPAGLGCRSSTGGSHHVDGPGAAQDHFRVSAHSKCAKDEAAGTDSGSGTYPLAQKPPPAKNLAWRTINLFTTTTRK